MNLKSKPSSSEYLYHTFTFGMSQICITDKVALFSFVFPILLLIILGKQIIYVCGTREP